VNPLRAIIFDPDTCLAQRQIPNITLFPAATAEELKDSVRAGAVDLVMVDMHLPGTNGLDLVSELRLARPNIPVIILTAKEPTDLDWRNAATARFLQLVQTPVTDSELLYHVTRLFPKPVEYGRTELHASTVDQLRNDQGRLDAKLVADLFGLTLTDVAANVGISRQALSKTPDSLSVQGALNQFERIARSLLTVTGTEKGLKTWLNAPNKRFDQHTPLEVIKLGKAALLADWVDDARLGSPQ